MRMFSHGGIAGLAIALAASAALADTVVLKNGDTLHGKIGQVTAAGLKFGSEAFGDITVPLDKLTSYKIDTPTVVQLKNAEPVTAVVVGGADATVKVNDQPYKFDQIKIVNPPPEK